MIDYVGNNTTRGQQRRDFLTPLAFVVIAALLATLMYWGASAR